MSPVPRATLYYIILYYSIYCFFSGYAAFVEWLKSLVRHIRLYFIGVRSILIHHKCHVVCVCVCVCVCARARVFVCLLQERMPLGMGKLLAECLRMQVPRSPFDNLLTSFDAFWGGGALFTIVLSCFEYLSRFHWGLG